MVPVLLVVMAAAAGAAIGMFPVELFHWVGRRPDPLTRKHSADVGGTADVLYSGTSEQWTRLDECFVHYSEVVPYSEVLP